MLGFLKKLFRKRSAAPPAGEESVRGVPAGQRRAEADLRQSEEQFGKLVAGVRDYAIFILDRQGNVATWNAGAQHIKGYTAEEIIGRHFSRFYPRDAVSSGWPAHELEVASATGRFEDEGWRVRQDGTRFWASVVITTLRDEAGAVRGFLKITRDLTDRKQAEEKLRLSEERFRLLVEGVQDYAIFMLDPQGRVVTWNAGAERLKGYAAGEIIGRHFSRFYPPEVVARGWPDEELRRAAAEGRFEDEGWRVRQDGTRFWGNVVITALRDEAGTLRGFAKVTRDLTARRQAEADARRLLQEEAARQAAEQAAREVARQREQLRVTLASIGDAVIVTDRHGAVTFLNPVAAGLTGWGPDEAAGQPLERVFRIVNEQTRQPAENPVGRVFREGAVVGLANHTALVARDGREVAIEDTAAPVRAEGGAVGGAVLVFRDVTERRRAEEVRRARERQLQLVTDTAPVFLAHLDARRRFQFVNKPYAARFGLHPRDVIGKTIAEVLGDEAFAVLAPHIDAALSGRRVEFEAEVPYRDIGPRYMRCAYEPERDGAGRVVGYVGALLDVTESRQVERALAASEQRFRTLTDHAPVGIFLTDARGNCLFVNRRWREMAGMSAEEALGQGWGRALHPDDRERVVGEWYAAAGAGGEFASEYRFRTRQGKVTWLRGSAAVLRNDAGEPEGFVGTVMDITEAKQAHEALRASAARLRLREEQLSLLTDALPALVSYVDADQRYRIVNRGYEVWFGHPRHEVQGRTLREVLGEAAYAAVREYVEAALAGREVTYERLVPYRDGGTRFIRATYVPHHGGGEVQGFFALVSDITELKRAEADARFLADASATLAALVDYESTLQKVARLAVPAFADWCTVDMLDEGGTLRRVAVAHVDPSKVELAHELHRHYPPDPAAPQGVWNVLRSGKSEIVPAITDALLGAAVRDAGLLRILRDLGLRSYMGVPLNVRGKVLGVVTFLAAESGRRYGAADLAVAEDLAHRAAVAIENARLYQELREADRRKDEFLAVLGHELRNPLAPIRNALHALKLPGADAAVVARAREMMERQVEHLVRLVDDLLDVARVMRGKVELRRAPVELATAVARAVETAQPVIDAEGQELDLALPPEPLWVHGDLVRLAQVIGNLLNNAAKYT
jgi:PAS domain S-box-containing protein